MKSMETAWFPLWLTAATALTPVISNSAMTGQQRNLQKSVELANHLNSPGNNVLDISSFSKTKWLLFLPSSAASPSFSWYFVEWKVSSFWHIGILCIIGVLYTVQFWGDLRDWHRLGLWGRFLEQNVMGNNRAQLFPRQSQRKILETLPPFLFFLSCRHGMYILFFRQTVFCFYLLHFCQWAL